MTKEIPLTKGKFAIVDDEDYEELSKYKWQASSIRRNEICYATRKVIVNGKRKEVKMHIVINRTPAGMDTDHINGNGLDNRKENLRTASPSQNAINIGKRKKSGTSSSYKGVGRNGKKWASVISLNGKKIYLGMYESEIEAARVYDAKAKELYGEFALLNFGTI